MLFIMMVYDRQEKDLKTSCWKVTCHCPL